MRFLILADIHANALALRAVLDRTSTWRLDGIISLGDNLNYGPQPRETMALLKDAGVRLLTGNHEERLLRMRAGDRDLNESYNWSMLRWTNEQVRGEQLDYPGEMTIDDFFLTHAVPGDLNRLIRSRDTDKMDEILQVLPQNHLVCGHNHVSWRHRWKDKEFVCPGSLGLLEDDVGERAAFALLEDDRVEVYTLPYDTGPLKRAYIENGLADAASEFARGVLQVIRTGARELGLKLMEAVQNTAREAGISWQCREAFRLAAESFPWTEDISCEEFWRRP